MLLSVAENLYKNVCAKDKHRFPFTENNILDRSFISKRKIDKSRFSALIKSGKAHGATVNDSLVAAYFQSLYELAGYDSSEIYLTFLLTREAKNSSLKLASCRIFDTEKGRKKSNVNDLKRRTTGHS